ncbi:MAG: 5-formyltetrahydrofolate cyclo-ligase [Pleurocapsa sp. SU_196_0]|nr:5-formyltetrahydrofolate cyclo-ligase [Pleurocapsa sp. SU_196_0]
MTAGEHRERIWSELVRQNVCAYPIPPHGHNPNFKGARAAARNLILHPVLAASSVVLVGMEAALQAVREEILSRGKTLVVPHRTKKDTYWALKDVPKVAAKIPNFSVYGEPTPLEGIEACVLASVIVDRTGARLSKGFGFGARGCPVVAPTLTVAHELMVAEKLEVEADSRVIAFSTPRGLYDARGA